jgi:hypothetical protein
MSDSSLAEDNKLNNEGDIEPQYGICRTLQDITTHYRDSSSLSPAQIMEQEVHYCSDFTALDLSYCYIRVAVFRFAMYQRMDSMIQGWIATQINNDDFLLKMQSKVKDIKTKIERFLFLQCG